MSAVFSACLALIVAMEAAAGGEDDLSDYQVVRVKVEDAVASGNGSSAAVLVGAKNESENVFLKVFGKSGTVVEIKNDEAVWRSNPARGEADVMLSSSERESLIKAGVSIIDILVEDVARILRDERVPAGGRAQDHEGHRFTFDRYHNLSVIYDYVDHLAADYPEDVFVESIGTSSEGREIKVVKVCKGGCGHRHVFFLDAGIHAREWVAPAAAVYLLRTLVEGDGDACMMTRNFDWHVVPVANPDGYEFTRSSNSSRFWRKTRQVNEDADELLTGMLCSDRNMVGIDANRNFDYQWGLQDGSIFPCSETYRGEAPFSSPVARHMADHILRHRREIVYYCGLHSYSQLIFMPYGKPNSTEHTEYIERVRPLAEKGQAAIEAVEGRKYTVIPVSEYFGQYAPTGTSMDWAAGFVGVPYAYTLELRPSPDEGFGFALPTEQILPAVKEAFAFQRTAAKELFGEFGYLKTPATAINSCPTPAPSECQLALKIVISLGFSIVGFWW